MKHHDEISARQYESRQIRNTAKPTVIERAVEAIGCSNVRFEQHGNFLWMYGRWVPASLNDIMRAANRALAADGKPQILNNPAWVVQHEQ